MRSNLIPALSVVVIIAALAFIFRGTIAGWFQKSNNDTQTVVLRQSPSSTPTATPTPTPSSIPAPTASSKSNHSIAEITPTAASLPGAGPADDLAVVGLLTGGGSLLTQYYLARKNRRLSALRQVRHLDVS